MLMGVPGLFSRRPHTPNPTTPHPHHTHIPTAHIVIQGTRRRTPAWPLDGKKDGRKVPAKLLFAAALFSLRAHACQMRSTRSA